MMRDLTVQLLHEVVGGRLRMATLAPRDGELALIERIATDSRHVTAGDVFWGLAGPRFDGAVFADEAYANGAAGVVVNRYVQPWPGCWSLEVDNGQEALVRLARWNRARFGGRVIGVTGSVGKTTTREMINAVLSTVYAGSASQKNYNNHLGVPLSLLALEPTHDFAVLEMGASAPGEIADLAELCAPHIGVITRLGEAHLGGFDSAEAVAQSKVELLAALTADSWAVLPGDDPVLRRLAASCRARIMWVGRSLGCDIIATDVRCGHGRLSFRVDDCAFEVPVWGRHHLASALAAIAVGKIFGLSLDQIAAGLSGFQPPPMRCQVMEVGGTTVIDDTYNASPTAMRAALELLRDFDAPGRRIVVCGDMRELGDEAQGLHRRLGDEVVTLCGADELLACGDHAPDVIAGAFDAGMPRQRGKAYREPAETLPRLSASVEPGDVVLIKGSRAMAMERLVQALQLKSPLARAA